MSFASMSFEVSGEIGIPIPLAQTRINEALADIYNAQMWSFQLQESGWLTPGLLFASGNQSVGTITATAYSNQIVGDATAAAAWVAYNSGGNMPPLTSFQIREPLYSLYNIIAFNGTNTFTLDRPWMEPSGTGLTYMVYQAYFPVPVADFKRFFEIRDTTNNAVLDYWTYSRRDIAIKDAQRAIYNLPSFVLPYEVDKRSGSATLGQMLYELWPEPLSSLPYTYSYLRRGPALVNPSDTLPYPLTEDMVKWKTKEMTYLWKLAQKDTSHEDARWEYLSQQAGKFYLEKAKPVKDVDRDMVELYWNRFERNAAIYQNGEPFATIGNGLNVGRMVG